MCVCDILLIDYRIVTVLTSEEYSVQSALVSGLLDSETATFADPQSGGKKYDINTAISMGLLEPTAHYTEERAHERLSLRNLLDRGIITTQSRTDRRLVKVSQQVHFRTKRRS